MSSSFSSLTSCRYNFDYEEIPEDDLDEDEEVTHWPAKGHSGRDHFGKRWCATRHSLLEYRFMEGADGQSTPEYVEPSSERW